MSTTGKATAPQPIRLPLAKARKFADKIVAECAEYCSLGEDNTPMIQVAGSIRRQRPECGDIDIVCLPRDGHAKNQLKARARKTNPFTLVDGNEQFRIILETPLGPVQVDFWFARHEERDMFGRTPANFGTLLLFATGNGRHNVWLVNRAKSQGKAWRPNAGVWLGPHCLASTTEQEIYQALDLDYLKPEDRER